MFEMFDIPGDQHQLMGDGDYRNLEIRQRDRFPGAFQIGSKGSAGKGGLHAEMYI